MALFVENYWGEKNNGFEVLLGNMKLGGKATAEFADFLREFSAIEDSYVKWLARISRQIQANASFSGCTLSPLWSVYKQLVDRLSTTHTQMASRLAETSKQVLAYSEEQHKRTKQIRDSETVTLEAVANFQLQVSNLSKCKEAYFARHSELERARREGMGPRDLEKLDAKVRKACDEYRTAIERYNSTRSEFERRHLEAARKLNEIEEQHITSICEFSNTFLESMTVSDSANRECLAIFRSQLTELGGAPRLLNTFVRCSSTGRERPSAAHFENPADERAHETLSGSSRNASQSKDSLSKSQRDKDAFERDTKRESERDSKREENAVQRTESPKPSESADLSAVGAVPRSTSAAFHLIRFDDSPTHAAASQSLSQPPQASSAADDSANLDTISVTASIGSKANTSGEKKKEAAASGSLAGVAAAMSRGLMKTTNWVGASIKQSRHKPKSKAGSARPESVAGTADGELLSLGLGAASSSSSLRQSADVTQAQAQAQALPGSAIDDLLSIDFGSSPSANDAALPDEPADADAGKRKPPNDSDSDSSSDDDDDAADRAFRNIHVRIKPLDGSSATAVSVDPNAHNDALKASVAELKLQPVSTASRKKVQARNTPSLSSTEMVRAPSGENISDRPVSVTLHADSGNPEFVADFSAFEQRVAEQEQELEQERDCPTPTPNWVAFGHESADNTLVGQASAEPRSEKSTEPERPQSVSTDLAQADEPVSNDASFANFASFSSHFPESEAADASLSAPLPLDAALPVVASHNSPISGKTTPNSLEVATLIPPPVPAKGSRRVVAATMSSGSDKAELPTPPNSSSSDPPRPPPPARSRSAFGMQAASPVAVSHVVTPPILEDVYAQPCNVHAQQPALPPRPPVIPERKSSNGSSTSTQLGSTFESLNSTLVQSPVTDPSTPPASRTLLANLSSAPRLPPAPSQLYLFDVRITEKVHAKIKGSVNSAAASQSLKLTGVVSLAFASAVARELLDVAANGSVLPVLRFRLNGTAAIDHIQVSKTLVLTLDATRNEYEVNVSALLDQLRAPSRTTDSMCVVDCVKYQCQSPAALHTKLPLPLDLSAFWKCDSAETDFRLEYAFRPDLISSSSHAPTLTNVAFLTSVSGGVQSMRPQTGTVDFAKQTVTWRVPDITDGARRALVANWQLANGPSVCAATAAQFVCTGHSLTQIDLETLAGASFKLASVKRSFVSGMYECEGTVDSGLVTPTHSANVQQQPFDAFSF